MKLVDKDEIMKFPIRLDHYDETNGCRQYALGIEAVLEYIDEMPTIEAIPIEWIEEWGWKNGMSESMSLRVMIDDWEKENESRSTESNQ